MVFYNTLLNFNKLVSDLDIETNSPDSWDCKDSKFCYQPAGHIVTGNLKIITDSRIRSVISKGPKYRFPAHIDFNKCPETIASAFNDYCTRWCKREHVESNGLNNWKLKIFKISDERVLFYSDNLDLLPPKKVKEKSRECHDHKSKPFPDTKRKRKPTNPNKHKSNKRTKSTRISSLPPKRGNRNAKRTEKHKDKMTQGKTKQIVS